MRNKTFFILAIVLLSAVILSSCSFPQKTTSAVTTVTATAGGETASTPSESTTEVASATSTPVAPPTTIPTSEPSPTPTPAVTNTPIPTPTNPPPAVSLPKKSSITGETLPKGAPAASWKGIPIPEGAITGQQKKNDLGERYYIFTIQSDVEPLLEYYTQALASAKWVSTEGGRAESIAFAFFIKSDQRLRFEFIIEDVDQNLILVRIFKWDGHVW